MMMTPWKLYHLRSRQDLIIQCIAYFLQLSLIELFHHHCHFFIVLDYFENLRESNKILARRLRDPVETRNGEQLRRDDAHIATKAGVAGHPSLPLSQRRGRIAATTAARTPVYRSGCASRVSIMTEGWLLWMNARSIQRRATPLRVFQAKKARLIPPRMTIRSCLSKERWEGDCEGARVGGDFEQYWRFVESEGMMSVTSNENDQCNIYIRE